MAKCPRCEHEMNEFEVNKLWCTNCNAKFSSPAELLGLDEEKTKEILQDIAERKLSVSGSTDNELSGNIEQSGKRVKNIFSIAAILVFLGAVIVFIGSFNNAMDINLGAGFMRVLAIEGVGVAICLYAMGDLIYYRTLGMARLIQQHNLIHKLLDEKIG